MGLREDGLEGGESCVWERSSRGLDSWVLTGKAGGPKFLSLVEVRAEDWAPTHYKEEYRVIGTKELDEWFSEENWTQNPLVFRSKQLRA